VTEAEWLVAIDPRPMLEFPRATTSERTLRLFCRRVYAALADRRATLQAHHTS
jgi:hypothetical protein